MRLVIYVVIIGAAIATGSAMSVGNDEPIAAKLAGLPGLTFLSVLAIPFVGIVVRVLRTFPGLTNAMAARYRSLAPGPRTP